MIRALCRPGMKIAEVGVFLGSFGQVLAGTLPEELVLIDTWEGVVESGNQDGMNVVKVDLEKAYPMIVKHYSRWDWVKVRRGMSVNVLKEYPDNYFDFVYIDANHSYEGVAQDLVMAYKKVKSGGYISFHDYDVNGLKCNIDYKFGVRQAVDDFCKRYGQKIIALGIDGCVSGALQLKK